VTGQDGKAVIAETCWDPGEQKICVQIECRSLNAVTVAFLRQGGSDPDPSAVGSFLVETAKGIETLTVAWTVAHKQGDLRASADPHLIALFKQGSQGLYRDAEWSFPFTLERADSAITTVENDCRR